jgi:hypothetical protein
VDCYCDRTLRLDSPRTVRQARGGMSRYRTLLSLGAIVIVVGLASLIATGAIRHAPPTPTPSAPQPSPMPRATTPATLDLSGTWTGLWSSGASNGFCTLTLTKTGNGLDGTFILSPPADILLHVKGLIGSAITLRSASGVVFTGTLSGSTLSGVYISNGKAYSWSVTLAA